MKTFILAIRYLIRDRYNPELRLLFLALLTAVTAVSSVEFFTDRIQRALTLQAVEILGADLRISSTESLPTSFSDEAKQRNLKIAQELTFPNVIAQKDNVTLVAIKAVSENYPLRGRLRISASLQAPATITDAIPAKGEVWLEPRLLITLNLQVGDKIRLGDAEFTIGKLLHYEPDRSGFLLQLAPRVLMNLNDIEKTKLVSAGSRVRHYLLISGETDKISVYRQWLQKNLQNNQQVQGIEDSRPEMQSALTRAEQFLGLATLITVILAGAAIAVAAAHFARQQADTSAVMRCLGATQKFILQIYLIRLLGLGLLASSFGCLSGWLVQYGIAHLVTDYLTIPILPTPSLKPLGIGFFSGLITLFGFALPPLLRIHTVSPLRVFRREFGSIPQTTWQVIFSASLAFILLIFWQARDPKLALWMIAGTGLGLSVMLGIAYLFMHALRLLKLGSGVAWRFGFANLLRRAQINTVQLTAFGISIMVLLLLSIVRVDLLNTWQKCLPEGTPNYFMINIQPTQVIPLHAKLQTVLQQNRQFYPMVTGRLLAINDKPVSAVNYTQPRAKRLVERTFNLSTISVLPTDNRVVAGKFWEITGKQQFSVEEGLAKTLGIHLGDTLRFGIGGQAISAPVTSLRSVQWDSFNANFFVLTSPDLMANLTATYMTSFYLPSLADPSVSKDFLPSLVREFSGVTVFDVNVMLTQVRHLIDRAALAIESIFLLTLIAGFIVLYATLAATYEERRYESAILRTLGATRTQILTGLIAEFATLGLLAGLLATVLASGLGYGLATFLFELPFKINGWLWFIGVGGSAVGISLVAVFNTRTLLKSPPLLTLRQVGSM